jgi:hypothetical protein
MKLLTASMVALTAALLVPPLAAQTHHKAARGHIVTLTGCVIKGDEPNEVWLQAKDGKIYGLESSKVKLQPHLGHTVTVTGSVVLESKKEKQDEAKEAGSNGKHEAADFRVGTLKMVSRTCQP